MLQRALTHFPESGCLCKVNFLGGWIIESRKTETQWKRSVNAMDPQAPCQSFVGINRAMPVTCWNPWDHSVHHTQSPLGINCFQKEIQQGTPFFFFFQAAFSRLWKGNPLQIEAIPMHVDTSVNLVNKIYWGQSCRSDPTLSIVMAVSNLFFLKALKLSMRRHPYMGTNERQL